MNEETPICADLDQIRTIVKVSGTLMNETPLRIGKGKEQSFVDPSDNPLLTQDGRPVIPGSSLKGLMRSLAESYVKTLNDPKYSKVCDLDDNSCESCTSDAFCIPCVLFGFKDISSRVFVMDSVALENEFRISQRTMVTLSRVFGGQTPKRLYTLDMVEPGAKFRFEMIVYNLDLVNGEREEWKIRSVEVMKYLIRLLTTEGAFIGSRKSTGLGLVKLTGVKVKLYKAPNLTEGKEVEVTW